MLWFRHRKLALGVFLVALPLFGSAACSDDDTSTPLPDAESDLAASSAGTGGASPQTGSAGGASDDAEAGAGGASAGGAGTGAGAGGDNGSGGAAGRTDASVEDGAGTAGTGGGLDASDANASPGPLTICARLTSPAPLSFDVTLAFEHNVFVDCRVKWITRLYLDLDERAQFLNGMLAWNLDFWGCSGVVTQDFALLYKPARLTPADADAIIEHYIDAATTSLAMSPTEVGQMRAALHALAQPDIDPAATGFSQSACDDGGTTDGATIDDGGADDGSPDASADDLSPGSDDDAAPPNGGAGPDDASGDDETASFSR